MMTRSLNAARSATFFLCAVGFAACDSPTEPDPPEPETDVRLVAAHAPSTEWQRVDLGLANSRAVDVNSHDQVVGTHVVSNITQGFLWDSGQITYLGHFIPSHIADDGSIAGLRFGRPAVRQGGSVTYLLPNNTEGRVWDMNTSGVIVGAATKGGPGHPAQPFIWDDGTLSVLDFRGHAGAISETGIVAGYRVEALTPEPWDVSGQFSRVANGTVYLNEGDSDHNVWGVDNYGNATTQAFASHLGCEAPRWINPRTGFDLTGIACGRVMHTSTLGYVITFDVNGSRLFFRASQSRVLKGYGTGALSAPTDISDGRRPWVVGRARTVANIYTYATVWQYKDGGRPTRLPVGRDVIWSSADAVNEAGTIAGSQDNRATVWLRN